MINTDEDALMCDLAETYQIYEYRSLPCRMAATFSCGLRNDSRIKMKMSGSDITLEQMMLASISDGTRMTAWMHTKDAEKGVNRPESLLKVLLKQDEKQDSDVVSFENGEEFDLAWERLTRSEVE